MSVILSGVHVHRLTCRQPCTVYVLPCMPLCVFLCGSMEKYSFLCKAVVADLQESYRVSD